MFIRKSTKKGHYLVEVAIVLPFFLLALISVSFFIKMTLIEINTMQIITDEARVTMAQAYVIKDPVSFPVKVKNRIIKNNKNVERVSVGKYRYLYTKGQIKGLISFDIRVNADLKIPLSFQSNYQIDEGILCRAFIGDNGNYSPFGFDRMERNEENSVVYIFPLKGKKYHNKKCSCINSKPTKMVLSKNVRDKYMPCRLCNSSNMKNGDIVYCYEKYGTTYHRKNCVAVDKYIIQINKELAIKKGFTACSKCGG